MSTTKTLKVNQNFDRLLKCRANGYYDYVNAVIPTKDTKNINVEMQNYDGLQYIFNNQGGKGISIIDFSDTVLPWKFEMNDYLARTRYCLKPYREEPYQVEILKQVPTNYNIVGTPTFNGDVVSGFSSSNHLTLKKPFIPQGAWEIVLKFKTNESAGVEQGLFGYNGAGLFKICLGGDNHIALSLSTVDNDWNIGVITGTTDIELNKFYWVKAEFNGNVYKLSLSDNGIDYNLEGTLETSSVPVFPNTTYLGVVNRDYNSLAGSIDLSESYIKLNEFVAEGIGELIEYAFTHTPLSANGTIGGSSFAVTADNDTNGSNPAYYAFDSNEWTYWRGGNVPGYIEFYNPAPIKVTALTWGFFYSYPTSGNVQGSNNHSDWTTITEFTNDTDSDFTISMSGNTNSYKYYRINVSAVNMDVIHCKNLSIVGMVKGYAVENTYNLSNAIYVKQWNLNTYGNIVVSNDGVVSNFSSSNYASINNVHINTEEDLLLVFRTSDDVSSKQTVFRSSANALEIYIESNTHIGVWNNSQSEEVFLTNASPNTEYYVKFRFLEDKNIEVGLSLNGSNYEWHSFRDTTLVYTNTAEYDIGKHSGNNSWYFRGTFDYNKSDIPQTGGKLKTEELYGILDIDGNIDIQNPLYCYVNRDQNLTIRQTKNISMDTSNWYLGEVKLGE